MSYNKISQKDIEFFTSITGDNNLIFSGDKLEDYAHDYTEDLRFFPEIVFQIFGAQDWAFYLLSQIFVLIAFYFVFKFATEILGNIKLSLISVLLLETIYFYNFTTPEFNVNVCQLPFWALTVYYSWKIYETKEV